MVLLKLLKNPAYVYDLCFVFYLKFNYKTYTDSLPEKQKSDKDLAFFNTILQTFGDIPDDLYVFFHAKENGLTFVPSKCIWPHEDLFTTEFDFNFFLQQFYNNEDITRKVLKFYFNDLTEEETAACMNSTAEVHQKIKSSDYSAEEKAKLYEFFFQPNSYIKLLRNQLVEKERILTAYYEKNYSKIFDVFNATTFDVLSKQVKELKDLSFLNESGQVLYTSYCLLHKYFIQLFCAHDNAVYLLGCEYQDILEFAKNRTIKVCLPTLGSALGEENRVLILKFLQKQEEASCKDLEKELGLGTTTVYHHITLMTKVGVLKTRNKGKSILYSINRQYFDAAIEALKEYSSHNK